MYAGCGDVWTDVPLYKSTDGGETWTASFKGIPGYVPPVIGVWGSSPTDLFAVGWYGTILHYDGSTWAPVDNGTTTDYLYDHNAVWGSSPTDVFAVADNGIILHYDGNTWTEMDNGTEEHLWGVWGSCATDVFAVGSNGTVLHYDGSTWSHMISGTTKWLNAVWGKSPTDVFAVGDNGIILHYDGYTWTEMNSGTTEHLLGVWGSCARYIFAVGGNGTILHYDGSTWSHMISGTTKLLIAVWGSMPTDIFAVGAYGIILHYDGSIWTDTSLETRTYECIWGTSGTDIFVGGLDGSILHYDGNAWFAMRPGGSFRNAVTDLEFHRQDSNIVYASTFGAGVYVSPNQAGDWLNLGIPDHNVHAISTSSLYAATQGGLLQCTGTGVIAGKVTDALSQSRINSATLFNDMGIKTISVNGEYMMVLPSGICDVTAIADGYANKTVGSVTVYGGDVSWADIAMQSGLSDPSATGDRGGGSNNYGCFITTAACESHP